MTQEELSSFKNTLKTPSSFEVGNSTFAASGWSPQLMAALRAFSLRKAILEQAVVCSQ